MRGWNRFFNQWQKDFKLWLFFMAYFFLFRAAFILIFRNQIDRGGTFSEVIAVLLNGIRFDSVIVTILILIPLCLSVISGFVPWEKRAERLRFAVGVVFLILSTFLCFITLSYFREYGDQFNHFIFGLIYDDLMATILTIIKAYHFVLNTLGIVAVVILGSYLLHLFITTPFIQQAATEKLFASVTSRVAATLLIVVLLVIGIRGSLGTVPVRERHAAIAKDEFLNKTVLNPYKALWYAIGQQMKLLRSGGIKVFLPDENLLKAAQFAFSTQEQFDDLDQYMLKSARGPKGIPPRHIFYIVAESYSAWPLTDRYEALHLADGVKGLAHEGISIDPFISGSQGTMMTLATIVTGLPDSGVMTNYRQSSRTPYPTSIAKIFKDMGYRTRFFYGGYLSWERVGDFSRDQGFDEIYGGGYMGNWMSSNEWGLADEHLFDFVLETIKDDTPSFNLILTTSFHPPFTVDVRSKGFTLKEIPLSLKRICIDDVDFTVWGHLWYEDKCIADFARRITMKIPKALVVVTSDHASRRLISKNPDIFEKGAIPCIFYGPEVLKGVRPPSKMAGSHLDLIPTLVELTAPPGFTYHTLGKDLLNPNSSPLAVGYGFVIGPSFFLALGKRPRLYALPGDGPSVTSEDIACMERLYDTIHGIAWWRIMHGPKIEFIHGKGTGMTHRIPHLVNDEPVQPR